MSNTELATSKSARSKWTPRRRIVAFLALLPLLYVAYAWITYPSDKTPEGAYFRIVRAVNQGKPKEFFAYTEEAAQHACYTIRDYRRRSLELAEKHYPKDELQRLRESYGSYASAPDGSDVFAIMVQQQGWLNQLRADLSAIDHVEQAGPRATVVTMRGTRYSMRRRPNQIWGLTAFTPALVEEAERAARDIQLIEKAARDYEREKKRPASVDAF